MVKEEDSNEDIDEMILSNPAFMVPRFNTLHSLIIQQVENRDNHAAQMSYQRMLVVYDEINRSTIAQHEKQRAYGKLMDVFSKLSNPVGYSSSTNFLTIGKVLFPISLMVVVLLIIFFARPEFSMTGLAIFNVDNSAPYWSAGSADFDIKGETHIGLNAYFKDADGDRLTYEVGGAPNIKFIVDRDNLIVVPDNLIKGMRVVGITAFDGKTSTRISARLHIG